MNEHLMIKRSNNTVADPVARKGGGKKHEIYAAAFGDHLLYDFIFTGAGGAVASLAPRIRYCNISLY